MDLDAYLARFAWHPEPELIGFRDEAASRGALGALNARTWQAALEFVYGTALERAMGDASGYADVRRRYYEPSGGQPASAPVGPMRAEAVIAEFEARIAGGLMN